MSGPNLAETKQSVIPGNLVAFYLLIPLFIHFNRIQPVVLPDCFATQIRPNRNCGDIFALGIKNIMVVPVVPTLYFFKGSHQQPLFFINIDFTKSWIMAAEFNLGPLSNADA